MYMSNDWFFTLSEFSRQNLFEVANLIIIGLGVWIAYQGLTTWKKQIRGQDEYKLAVEIMESSYDLEERLRYARGRLYSYTIEEAQDKNQQRDIHYQKHVEKINFMLEANNKLRVLKLRADALWGRANTTELTEILDLIKQFVIDFEIFYEAGWDDLSNRKGSEDAEEIWITMHGSFSKDKPDTFGVNFSAALKSLEDKMRKKIANSN